eukprot:382777-Ditylum_brightwellii.AAC.1
MHYQIGTEDPGAPKTTQHTRDNQHGFVQHQVVAAASQSIASTKFKGKNSTTAKCTEDLIIGQFCRNQNNSHICLTDTREHLDPHGKKGYKCKEYSIRQKKTTAGAFVDGNNNVILGLSTMYRENEWDGVLANPNDMK